MTNKEFIKVVKDISPRLDAKLADDGSIIVSRDKEGVVMIRDGAKNIMDLVVSSSTLSLSQQTADKINNYLIELLSTPVSKRKSEKKYALELLPDSDGERNYLADGPYCWGMSKSPETYTASEIKHIKQEYSSPREQKLIDAALVEVDDD